MKKLVLKLILLSVILLSVFVTLDITITKGLYKRTDYVQEVWNDIRQTEIGADVLIMGSCQAQYDYNPYIMDSILGLNSYVAAMNNQPFPSHDLMWTMYKKYQKKLPKVIVINLDYADMNTQNIKESQENEPFLFLAYEPEVRKFMAEYGGYNWMDLYIPCYRYYGHHNRIKYGMLNSLRVSGYEGHRERYKGAIQLDKEYTFHREWYGDVNYVSIKPEIVKMFDDFLSDCKSNDVEVVLLLSPLCYTLSEIIANTHEIYDIYRRLADKYDFQFWDYASDYYLCNDTCNFESPNHLNKQSANIYTTEISVRLDSIIKK